MAIDETMAAAAVLPEVVFDISSSGDFEQIMRWAVTLTRLDLDAAVLTH